MSFARSVSTKTAGVSTKMPPLPTLHKLPNRLQPKKSNNASILSNKIELSTIPNHEELDDIVNNLSTIVKRSEEILTPIKSSYKISNIRRTSSLHINNRESLSNSFVKTSNSHHDQLNDSNMDTSRLNVQRRSLRNIERFSGIKCSLPSGTSTLPNTYKGLEKHVTPTKPKPINTAIENQMTPAATNGKAKSPWRLRFEKFLNHQELTPLSPADSTVAFTKNTVLNKENRTPSFRPSTRRTSNLNKHKFVSKDNM